MFFRTSCLVVGGIWTRSLEGSGFSWWFGLFFGIPLQWIGILNGYLNFMNPKTTERGSQNYEVEG